MAKGVTLASLGVLALEDLRTRVVPDRLVSVAYTSTLVLLAMLAVTGGAGEALGHVVAGALLFAVGAAVALVSREGAFGGGDVKVMGLIGLGLGGVGILAVAAGQLMAGLYVVGRYVVARVPLRDPIPLVPFLALGASLAVAVAGR